MGSVEDQHLILRQPLFGKLFLGAIGLVGAGLSVAAILSDAISHKLTASFSAEACAFLAASILLASYYSTTEVHATSDRLWLRRFGLDVWSVPLRFAGTTEGKGVDWRFIFVFDLRTKERVGKFNWYMFGLAEAQAFGSFIDSAREAQGVSFGPTSFQ
jgi:hypothetical protein